MPEQSNGNDAGGPDRMTEQSAAARETFNRAASGQARAVVTPPQEVEQRRHEWPAPALNPPGVRVPQVPPPDRSHARGTEPTIQEQLAQQSELRRQFNQSADRRQKENRGQDKELDRGR